MRSPDPMIGVCETMKIRYPSSTVTSPCLLLGKFRFSFQFSVSVFSSNVPCSY